MKDKFISISAPSEGLYKEKGSRFIAYALPVSSEREAADALKALSVKHHAARHICYAYRIAAPEGELWRASDAGEPSGTAGRPILSQIDARGMSNVLVAVVRYFGGILLGAAGLGRAYRAAAADALDKAVPAEKTLVKICTVIFDYERQGAVEKILRDRAVSVVERSYGESCVIKAEVPLSLIAEIGEQLKIIANFIE